ncbi:hypothetical protein DFH06DRAFT_232981 [Mycena polygramma]|nr:hypothetical protein DFH06DRAFT_232981 [Mycena polygramma]
MAASFLRGLRRKDRSSHSMTTGSAPAVEVPLPPRSTNSTSRPILFQRRPSDTPSEAARLFRLFKGSNTETDTSSLASADENVSQTQVETPARSPPFHFPPNFPPSSHKRVSPLSSPHSLDRPLPPLPPVRPPRPPSLNLDPVPLAPAHPNPKEARRPQRRLIPEQFGPGPGRKMPELDNVWEGFIRDVEGEDVDDYTVPPRRHGLSKDRPCVSDAFSPRSPRGVQAILDTSLPRRAVYRAGPSRSTPYLGYPPELISDSESEYSTDETSHGHDAPFSLSLFPAPPPIRRRATAPKPLVLLPTPSIAPLPPSPSWSSRDSTPVATPTTSRSFEPSPLYSQRKGILKTPSPSFSPSSLDQTRPPTPPTPTFARPSPNGPSPYPLRSAKSVPHFQPLSQSTAHRNTSSDTTSVSDRRRVLSRPKYSM